MLARLKSMDEALTMPIFELSLPKPLEFLLSLPGNLLGPPCLQFCAPLLLFLLLSKDTGDDVEIPLARPWLLVAAVLSTSFFLVLPFLFFLRGHLWMISHILYPHASFALSPLLGLAVSFYLGPTPYVSALCYHAIMLYNLSCVAILFLKHGTRRLRPCVVFPHCIERKHFPVIPKILAKHASFTSFPSGDAMAAACWAVPLADMGYPREAVLMATMTAFGRMYFLAHHLGDTVVGIGVCLAFHTMLCVSPSLPTMGAAEWYHPLTAFAALVVASRFRSGDQK